ncbi:MAG: phosphoribosyl-AMP cyclohydrolase [Burkholderiales bacterium]|jgi:phosphoribosyl-AMP cyclohydrolase|nr:phosphoribosyl-AMP cyclohydrolase [Burkholderiales bacterium]
MATPEDERWLDEVAFDASGRVPAIAQDAADGRILMFAWMNREALALTRQTGFAHYWSRSRGKLWRKGEESGHLQKVSEIRLDCDEDVILLMIEQVGGIACHTGRASCFYRRLEAGGWVTVDPVLKPPAEIYSGSSG